MFPYFFKRKDITMKNFNCFNKEFSNGNSRPCTELHDYYKISYNEPKDGEDDSVDTLNFCFAKRKDQIDITTYRNINKIHLNYANLAKTRFWSDKKYNIVIRNDHKKKFFTFIYRLNTIICEPKPYLACLWKFLSLNQENIESIEFINIKK